MIDRVFRFPASERLRVEAALERALAGLQRPGPGFAVDPTASGSIEIILREAPAPAAAKGVPCDTRSVA